MNTKRRYIQRCAQRFRLLPYIIGMSLGTAASASLITGDTAGGAADLYGDFVVDLSGLTVIGPEGTPGNPYFDLTMGDGQEGYISENVLLAGIRWDLNYETFNFAWLSDLRIGLTVNAGQIDEQQLLIAPGFGDDFAGLGEYASDGWINLNTLGKSMFVGADDTIRMEVFNAYNFIFGDTVFGQGSTLTLGLQVPAPSSSAVFLLVGAMVTRRRRS
ncbi:MAG: hypothetical protein KC996_06525 [Phycisphaerales bacterium]|nr:hypothetical protein [Phycisphaerales bacterium]